MNGFTTPDQISTISIATDVPSRIKRFLEDELLRISVRKRPCYDAFLSNCIYFQPSDYRGAIANIEWRLERQMKVWSLFGYLVAGIHIDPRCLARPINLDGYAYEFARDGHLDRVCLMKTLLGHFKIPYDDDHKIRSGQIPGQTLTWDRDLAWLAVMIIRGGREIRKLLMAICESNYLGPFVLDTENSTLFEQIRPHSYRKLEYAIPREFIDGMDSDTSVGFVLPHALSPGIPLDLLMDDSVILQLARDRLRSNRQHFRPMF